MMRYMILSVILSIISLNINCGKIHEVGADSRMTSTPLSVSELLRPLNQQREVRVQGVISTVCPDDGCWVVVTDNANVLRVESKQKSFEIPKEFLGKKVLIEGMATESVVSRQSPGFAEYERTCGVPSYISSDTSRVKQLGDIRAVIFTAERVELAD
jgi:hypothetical protein